MEDGRWYVMDDTLFTLIAQIPCCALSDPRLRHMRGSDSSTIHSVDELYITRIIDASLPDNIRMGISALQMGITIYRHPNRDLETTFHLHLLYHFIDRLLLPLDMATA